MLYGARRKATLRLSICASVGALSFGAQAQSSVTLSGMINSGVLYANNVGGHSQWLATSSQLTPTRVIFHGTEDLGGGTSAVFRLMSPFNIQTGGGSGRAFNVSYVGFERRNSGRLTFGRQFEALSDMTEGLASTSTWSGNIGAHIGNADNQTQPFKSSNAIKYLSSAWCGLSFGVTYGFSNSTEFSENRLMSAGVTYRPGPFRVSLGYMQADRPDSQTAGAVGTSGPGINDDYKSPFAQSVRGAGVFRQRISVIGASYDWQAIKIGGEYTHVQYDYLDSTGLNLDTFEANLRWQMSPFWMSGVAYIRSDGKYKGGSGAQRQPSWDQIDATIQYALSKRTFLYFLAVAQQAHGAKAQIYTLSASSSNRQFAVTSGIQHNF
ncbi:porin [Paraburkholderia sp. J8-2]|uniref:porin n=1 Tax=Paraburkholderia sp. J8-2 TaxID=2805440 RepID=UPI002AB774A1|nr:porin [Paraburkholderia sp. J8-2]